MWNGDSKTLASNPTLIYNHTGMNLSTSSMNLKYQFINNSGCGYAGDATKKRRLEVLNEDLSMPMVSVPSHPGSYFQNSGDITSFPTMNPKFDKPQVDHSLKSGIHMKQNSQFVPPNCSVSQSEGYQRKDMPVSVLQIPDNEIQNSYVAPPVPPTSQDKELSAIGIPAVIEIPRLPFSQHFTYNVATQVELRAFQPNLFDASMVTEKEQVEAMPTFSDTVRNHVMDAKDSKNVLSFHNQSTQTSAASEGGNCKLDKEEIKVPRFSAHVPQDIRINHSIETILKPDCTDAPIIRPLGGEHIVEMTGLGGSLNHSTEASGGNGYILINSTVQPCGNQSSALVDESMPTARNVNPLTAAKLWDGALQLSTSTVVSAVAFFKSGEKASVINWPPYIEVKGKVRLEAFEKFIQELPRSRSRALMVISLCWKVGSSEAGLTCMKEVTKIYKEGQRVGYAQLSPGTDLYVCPRSNTIITILAKYGFFKGMAAVEEDQDSLIGCVVWRRNLASSSAKAMGSKRFRLERSSDSPTEESGRQAAKSITTPATEHESEKSQAILRSEDNTSKPNPVQPVALCVPEKNSTSNSSIDPILVVDRTNGSSMNSVITTTEMQVKHDATIPPTMLPTSYLSASMKADLDVNVKEPPLVVELPLGVQNKHNSGDDDDLPEFDFDAACGAPKALKVEVSWSPVRTSPTAVQFSKQINVEQSESSCKTSKTSENFPSFKVPHFPSTLSVTNLNKVGDLLSEKKAAVQTTEALGKSVRNRENGISTANVFSFHGNQKKIWDDDDDDDMPEWCPPDMDIGKSPSPPPLMFLNHPFHPPDRGWSDPRPSPLPPGPLPCSHLRHFQEGTAMLSPEPSRLPKRRLALGHGFPQQQLAMSKYSSIIDRGRQTLTPHMPSVSHQSSEDSPRWSPSCKNRFQSSWKQDHGSPFDYKYGEDHHDWRNAPENVSSKLHGNGHGRYGGKPDRCYDKHRNEELRGRYTDSDLKFDYQKFTPKRKPNEPARRRPTGFDVLPNSPSSTPAQFDVLPSSPSPNHGRARERCSRRRPSLFDVKPRDHSNDTRW